jgi:nitrogen fixation/metabolism regulation signal transduction histidine kinase
MRPATEPECPIEEDLGPLEMAFLRFQKAVTGLEGRHSDMRRDVARLERDLTDARRQIEAILDAVDAGLAVVTPDGRVRETNRVFRRLERVGPSGHVCSPTLGQLIEMGPTACSARVLCDSPDGPCEVTASLVPLGNTEGTRVLTLCPR